MERRLLNPKIDFVFKKIFGSEKHPGVLISFLNAVLKPKNEIINIEIQLKNEYNKIQRSLYYWSKLYEEQLEEGDRYDKLCRTVCINILDFKYLKNDRFHNGYRLKEIETNEELTDLEEIHLIEIPKLKKINSEQEIVDVLEGWVEFLREPESEVVRKLEMTNKEIREAKDELYRLSMDEKERALYFIREKSIRDEISALANAEEKGIEKGVEQRNIEIVSNMLSEGLSEDMISKLTKIDINKVIEIKNRMV